MVRTSPGVYTFSHILSRRLNGNNTNDQNLINTGIYIKQLEFSVLLFCEKLQVQWINPFKHRLVITGLIAQTSMTTVDSSAVEIILNIIGLTLLT